MSYTSTALDTFTPVRLFGNPDRTPDHFGDSTAGRADTEVFSGLNEDMLNLCEETLNLSDDDIFSTSIFEEIVGSSEAICRLTAQVMRVAPSDATVLITGESGTGKELVARAIAMARYIPFDAKSKSFVSDYTQSFYPLNLSALSPTLIESELFGHRRGAFTGALEDRAGWLETCPPLGTVFLDEIGELDPTIQVKLLRVLQTRRFQRLGAYPHRNVALYPDDAISRKR